MRVVLDLDSVVASVDVPTGYPGDEHDRQSSWIRDFVENSYVKVTPNSAYRYLNQRFDETGQWPSRAGYHNRFWFYDISGAASFADMVNGKLEVPPIKPNR